MSHFSLSKRSLTYKMQKFLTLYHQHYGIPFKNFKFIKHKPNIRYVTFLIPDELNPYLTQMYNKLSISIPFAPRSTLLFSLHSHVFALCTSIKLELKRSRITETFHSYMFREKNRK